MWFGILLLVVLLGSLLLAVDTMRQTRNRLHEKLLHHATQASRGLSPSYYGALSGSESDLSLPAYRRVKDFLTRLREDTPDCRFAYLMRLRQDGAVVILADSEPPESEDYSPPGVVYHEADPVMRGCFGSGARAVVHPVRDRWGSWMSAFVPVKDPATGEVVAVFGMDVATKTWWGWKVRAAAGPLLLSALLLVLTGAGYALVRRHCREGEGCSPMVEGVETGLVVVLGLLLTANAAWLAARHEDRERKRSFALLAESGQQQADDQLRTLRNVHLPMLARFVESSEKLTEDEFIHFVGAVQGFPSVCHYWAWVPRVVAEDRGAFEASASSEAGMPFMIWERSKDGTPVPARERPVHFPVRLLGPSSTPTFGFDLASEPRRMGALLEAAATGLPVATEVLDLEIEGQRQRGMLLFHPVRELSHDGGLKGFVVASVHPERLLADVSDSTPVHHRLHVLRRGKSPELLASSCNHVEFQGFSSVRHVGRFGLVFRFETHAGPAFMAAHPCRAAWMTSVVGALLTLAVSLVFWVSQRGRRRLERLVAERTSELSLAEEKHRVLVETSQTTLYTLLPDGTLTYLSPGITRMLGYGMEEMVGKNFRDMVHADDIAACEDFLRRTLEDGESPEGGIEYRILHKDGSYRWNWSQIVPFAEGKGEARLLVGNGTDITPRKEAEAERDRLLAEAQEGRRVLLGVVEDQTLTERELLRRELLFEAVAEAAQTLLSERDLDSAVSLALSLIGEAVAQDRVYLFEHHGELKIGESRMSQRYEWIRDGVSVQIDNPALQNISFERISPRTFESLCTGQAVEGFVRDLQEEERKFWDSRRVVSFLAIPVWDGGQFWGFLGLDNCSVRRRWSESERAVLATVAASLGAAIVRHRNAERLKAALDRHQAMLDANPDLMFIFSGDGTIEDFHTSRTDALFKSPAEFLGRSVLEVLPEPLASDTLLHIHATEDTGKLQEYTYSLEIAGVLRHYESRMVPCGINRVIASVRDVTERKLADVEQARLREQLEQSQKLDSVGRLAGGVAHDFNNMLQAILGHTELAMDQVDPSQPIYEDLQEIQKAATRSASLTRQLLAFARKQTVSPKVVDLNDTVEGMLKMLRRLIGENIDLTWHPGKDLGDIWIDPSQVDQILANLCVNARDAIQDTGRILLETSAPSIDESFCEVHQGAMPGEYVMLSVSDNGHGMDPATLAKVFEPFFTTKALGQGTGLGLSTVYGIVRQNNGFVLAYSEPGRGTTFRIYLPSHIDESVSCVVAEDVLQQREVHGTILLVEDEPTILSMASLVLERAGYAVLAAGSPAAALALVGLAPQEIDLLMTDVIMPGMNGSALAKKIRTRLPEIRCLYMSGYTADAISHHGVLEDGVHFIQKPFTVKEILSAVQAALS